jgi:hypothetical protein
VQVEAIYCAIQHALESAGGSFAPPASSVFGRDVLFKVLVFG